MKRIFLLLSLLAALAISGFAQPSGSKANQYEFVSSLPVTCTPGQGRTVAVTGAVPVRYYVCTGTDTWTEYAPGINLLTSTRIPFGDVTNKPTESADFTFNNTTKSLTVNSTNTAFINLPATSTASAIRFNSGTHPGTGGGLILPFVGGGQSGAPGVWWCQGAYASCSGVWLNLGFNFQGAGSSTSPVKFRKGTGTSSDGDVIFEWRPDDGVAQFLPHGVAAGQTVKFRFFELAANGSNYVEEKAPDNIAANVTFTKPAADGTNGQLRQTNGSGVESFGNCCFGLFTATSGSGAQTIDWATTGPYATRQHTLTGNNTFTFNNLVQGRYYTIIVIQDATGGRTVTWPAAVKWPGATPPTLTLTANAKDAFTFVYDGTNLLNTGQSYDIQ